MSRPLPLGLLVALGACAPNPPPVTVSSVVMEREHVRGVMNAALHAAAAGREADSLYLVGATVITDGVPGLTPAPFAGVRPGGAATVSGATMEITPYLAWGMLEYRWTATTGSGPSYGRATFVLERVGGSWRIKHLHTSSLRRN